MSWKTLGGTDEEQLMREDVAMLYARHEALMLQRKFVDFVDLVAKPARALADNRPHYGDLADKFQYVLVDEYQDVTFAMVQLIKQLAKNAKSLWVVGDVRQAIHHWRGASVESLRRFAQVFKEQAGTARNRPDADVHVGTLVNAPQHRITFDLVPSPRVNG